MKGSWNSMSIIPVTLCILYFSIYNMEDVFAAPTRHLCRPEQRDALLKFKDEFEIGKSSHYMCFDGITPHPKTESWANSSDCCSWEGVTCNAKSGEVIQLDLNCSCLYGMFQSNSSLQNLRFLTALDLSYNNFSGQIPSWIGKLYHLTSLNLSDNHFLGEIPSSIGNLSNLSFLDLSFNNFGGQIPSWIGKLSHLTSLKLYHNNLLGEVPSSVGKLSNLTSLNLSFNYFLGDIPSSIGNLSNLIFLDLSRNDFFGQITPSIGNLTQLTFLNLSRNRFLGQIMSSIGNLYKLTALGLAWNNFDGEFPSSFGNLNKLKVLHVYSNKLTGNFPVALLNLTQLSYLSLSYNRFTGTLPPNISSLSKLVDFVAADNAFTGTLPSLFTIPSLEYVALSNNQFNGTLEIVNISSPSKLERLSIGSNNFTGPIPSSISKLTNLSALDLSYFNTQGPIDFSIFSHLKSLSFLRLSYLNTTTTIDLNDILPNFKSLSILDVSGNHVSATNESPISDPSSQSLVYDLYLSGCGITKFPELLRTHQELGFLDISNNKIKGQVPGWLWTLPNQVYVKLSNNAFTGFENLSRHVLSSALKSPVWGLFGSNNNFTGKIPSFICALRFLTVLDLSDNNFNGSIPRCMGNLKSNLSVLNLHQNRLHGGLPESIFERLRSLDVGYNQLEGKLPRSLIQFSNLEVLNVESNRINDTFPFWLSSLPKLKVLVLQASFTKLKIIDLSHNQFNGILPSNYFVSWSAMSSAGTDEDRSNVNYMGERYYEDSMILMNKGIAMELVRILTIYTALDFSGNKFEGQIPKSIGLLKELHVLNLSNNAFSGHIPSSMGNLTSLESLDVSQNQISGEIPQELGSLSFLAYMNFYHNQLAGLVPDGTQFGSQKCSSYEDNIGLFGPSLEEVCSDIHTLTSQQQYETLEAEEEDEGVLSWIAVVIGAIPGIALGVTIGYILVPNKPDWFMNPLGRDKRRRRNTTTH